MSTKAPHVQRLAVSSLASAFNLSVSSPLRIRGDGDVLFGVCVCGGVLFLDVVPDGVS